MKKRKPQVGVMGSAADLKYSDELQQLAECIGELLAENNVTLVYGAEKDSDSLSTAAARGAKKKGGMTVGVTYGKGMETWDEGLSADVVIACGLERGGGREFVLVNSCDALIAISGGSGTLTEIAIAYQSDIPVVALNGVGGWSEKLAGTFLDDRKRRQIFSASTPKQAVELVLQTINET